MTGQMTDSIARLAERAWAPETAGARALRATLVPAAVAYGAAAALRNRLYDTGWFAIRRVPAARTAGADASSPEPAPARSMRRSWGRTRCS